MMSTIYGGRMQQLADDGGNYARGGLPGMRYSAAPPAAPHPAAPPPGINPSYLSQLGLNIGSNPALLSGVPSVNPQQLDPNSVTAQILGALMPQFAQQQRGLTEGLANAGIVGGSTAGAEGALGAQQQQQALGQIAPIIQSILQGNQQTNLYGQELNQGAAMQGGEFNASQQNAAQQFDIGNILRMAMQDSSTFNNFQGDVTGMQNQDWLALLGAQSGLAQAGAGAQAGAFQPNYQQPTPMNFGGLGAALAPTPTISGNLVPGSVPPLPAGFGYGY